MIDWTQPCETTETPPRPVRVLATDVGDFSPVVVALPDGFVLRFNTDGTPYFGSHVSLRNVAPPKPEPVMREAWVNCYAPDNIIGHATREEADRKGRPDAREACLRVAWMSDGSPVPGEDKTAEYKADRDWLSQKYQDMIAERDSLKAEVERLNKANLRLLGEIGQMRPVVDAAVAYGNSTDASTHNPTFVALMKATYAYQNTLKKTVGDVLAGIRKTFQAAADDPEPFGVPQKAAMMGPVKSCETCRHANPRRGCYRACGSELDLWEAK